MARRGGPQPDELLVLKVTLESDPSGMPAAELRAGDVVAATISDKRDIAKYLAKFFGGHSDHGPVPIPAPVEAIEAAPTPASGEPQALLVRVRFSAGVCGDAEVRPRPVCGPCARRPASGKVFLVAAIFWTGHRGESCQF